MEITSIQIFTPVDDWDGYYVKGTPKPLYEKVESINILGSGESGDIQINLGNGKCLIYHDLPYVVTYSSND